MAGLFSDFDPMQRLAANQHGPSVNKITTGSLISFHYPQSYAMIPNVIHDPYPLVIITDIWSKYIRGLNLHYLTFPYVKRILSNYGGRNFNYQLHIKPDRYMAQAFRMYVRQGVRNPKRLDTEWLMTVLNSVRSFSPAEVERIKASIQKQIQDRLQVKAGELNQWKAGLNNQQMRSLNTKTNDIQSLLTGGNDRNLIIPSVGENSPNNIQLDSNPQQPNVGE